MWSFQDLEVLSEENGDDEEYGMARNACNDVQIIYSSIAFMCARSFCKNANQIYCRKVIVLHPAETLLPLLLYLSNYDFSVQVELPVVQPGQCWIAQH